MLVPWRTHPGVHSYTFVYLEGDQGSTSAVIPQALPSDNVYMFVPMSLCVYGSMCSYEDEINVEYPSVHSPS